MTDNTISLEDARTMSMCLPAITPSLEDFAGNEKYVIRHKGLIFTYGNTPEEAIFNANCMINQIISRG